MKMKREKQTVDSRGKDFLTEAEMKRFLDAARRGRHGIRDYLMMLMTYRHGLRVSELVDLRLKDLDLETGQLYVRRKKGSLSICNSAYRRREFSSIRILSNLQLQPAACW
jgi:integrase